MNKKEWTVARVNPQDFGNRLYVGGSKARAEDDCWAFGVAAGVQGRIEHFLQMC